MENKSLEVIGLIYDQHPGYPEPSPDDWKKLDDVLQQQKYLESNIAFSFMQWHNVKIEEENAAIERYQFLPYDLELFRAELQGFLPETYRRKRPQVAYGTTDPVTYHANLKILE